MVTPVLTLEVTRERIADLRRGAEAGRLASRSRNRGRRPGEEAPGWLVWAALSVIYVVWGSTYLAIRLMVETVPPFLGASARFLVAGTVMAVVILARRGVAGLRVGRSEVLSSALVGGLLLFGGNGLVTVAEVNVPSSVAALIVASVPLWVVGFRSLSGDRVGRGTMVGAGVGFAGVALLVLPGGEGAGGSLSGSILLVLAAASWAFGSFLSKKVPLPKDPFTSTAWQMLLGGAILGVAGVLGGEAGDVEVSAFSVASLGGLAYLIVAGSLLGFTAYTWLLQNAPISTVSTYAYVNPVIAIVLGWLALSEAITPTIAVGAAIILASVAFIVRKESPAGPRPEEAGLELSPAPEKDRPAAAMSLDSSGGLHTRTSEPAEEERVEVSFGNRLAILRVAPDRAREAKQ